MELDDLKKSWQTMDEKLQSKQLLKDDELLKMIQNKKKNAQKSQRSLVNINLIGLSLATILILFVLLTQETEKLVLGKLYWWTLVAFTAIGIPWNIYTVRYLHKTNILEMPLATVVKRINRYNYWMTIERVIGAVALFIFALISIIKLQTWKLNGFLPWFIYGIWIIAFIVYFLFVNKVTFKRLRLIRRNLDELKEVNNKNQS
jgi:hypothetical protein